MQNCKWQSCIPFPLSESRPIHLEKQSHQGLHPILRCFCLNKVNTILCLTLQVSKIKLVEFANSLDPDEAAHYELSHLDVHCLLASFFSKSG